MRRSSQTGIVRRAGQARPFATPSSSACAGPGDLAGGGRRMIHFPMRFGLVNAPVMIMSVRDDQRRGVGVSGDSNGLSPASKP